MRHSRRIFWQNICEHRTGFNLVRIKQRWVKKGKIEKVKVKLLMHTAPDYLMLQDASVFVDWRMRCFVAPLLSENTDEAFLDHVKIILVSVCSAESAHVAEMCGRFQGTKSLWVLLCLFSLTSFWSAFSNKWEIWHMKHEMGKTSSVNVAKLGSSGLRKDHQNLLLVQCCINSQSDKVIRNYNCSLLFILFLISLNEWMSV